MAIYYPVANSINPGTQFSLVSGDMLILPAAVNIVSTTGTAIAGTGTVSMTINGNVFGYNAINVSGASSFADLYIGQTGRITGATGFEAIRVTSDYLITNYGEINIAGAGGYGIYADGSGTTSNFGSVTAGFGFVGASGSSNFLNYGNLVGSNTAYQGGSGVDRVVNHGVIQGFVNLGNGNDIFVVADGRLYGTLDGGSGSDTISFEGFGRGIIADMAVGLTWDGQRNQVINNVENATGGSGSDIFFGSEGDNVFDPGSTGADQIFGYGGNDTVSYVNSIRSLIIDLTAQVTWDGFEGDSLQSIENATGSRFNDTIYGDGGNNIIDGGPEGADKLYGEGGIDTISYATSERGVIIDMNAGATWDGLVGDTIGGFENATGSAFTDSIYGDGGANTIIGGRGLDTIITGAGADRIVAASRSDLSFGRDIITDFLVGQDKMIFNVAEGYSSSAGFVAGAAPAASTGTAAFLYNTGNGLLSYDADGNGAGGAVNVASFTNLPTLGLSDFIFV